jgi:hypothetical protein
MQSYADVVLHLTAFQYFLSNTVNAAKTAIGALSRLRPVSSIVAHARIGAPGSE